MAKINQIRNNRDGKVVNEISNNSRSTMRGRTEEPDLYIKGILSYSIVTGVPYIGDLHIGQILEDNRVESGSIIEVSIRILKTKREEKDGQNRFGLY